MTGIRTSTIMMGISRDGLGRKTGMAMNKFNSTGGLMSSDNRKYTGNGHVVSKNVLVMSRFPGGYSDALSQHIIPIQVENLILRNMGLKIFRDGSDHAPLKTYIPNHSTLPILR